VHGDGSSLWASCHADDVARAFVEAAGNACTFGKSYHTAGEEWMTWNRMHEIVAEALNGPPPTFVHIPTDVLASLGGRAFICRVNFQYNNIFDNAEARRDLEFRCTMPFAEGARRVVAYLQATGRISNSDDDPYDDRIIDTWRRHQEQIRDLDIVTTE
jgi:nucleoside-diphosphate-sugar epimerase